MEVGFNVKYPIILDARHLFVHLFLEHTHVKHYHQGVEYLRSIRQEHYTVMKLRSSLLSIEAHCLRCREFQAATMQPIMSDLPKGRLAYQSLPFTNTGVEPRAQSYANAIWSRWIREYVSTLNRRSKWQTPAEQHLKTGDLVWIVEETSPRGYYPTPRIVELSYGSDSVARSAVLRTSTGSLVRPLVKLVPVFQHLLPGRRMLRSK